MQDCAIIIAPHWEKGGSNNIFAAEIAFYKNKGWKTVLILLPEVKWRKAWKKEINSELKADVVSSLLLKDKVARLKFWASKALRRQNVDGILHRNYMMRPGKLRPAVSDFLKTVRVREICVNWCDNVDFALRIRDELGDPEIRVVAHTHDIMAHHKSERSAKRQARSDAMELAWLNKADRVIHVSDDDASYFADKLTVPQSTSYITLHPEAERRLTSFQHRPRQRCVLYVGSWNVANPPSVEWFIKQVLPFTDKNIKFVFAGNICDFIQEHLQYPFLHLRDNIHLLGRVEDISELYENAQAVMLPTTMGSGASVKFVEALAMGVPMVLSPLAVRGLPAEVKVQMAPFIADRPIEFAEKLSALLDGETPDFDFREVYRKYFCNEAWGRRLDALDIPDASPHAIPTAAPGATAGEALTELRAAPQTCSP